MNKTIQLNENGDFEVTQPSPFDEMAAWAEEFVNSQVELGKEFELTIGELWELYEE